MNIWFEYDDPRGEVSRNAALGSILRLTSGFIMDKNYIREFARNLPPDWTEKYLSDKVREAVVSVLLCAARQEGLFEFEVEVQGSRPTLHLHMERHSVFTDDASAAILELVQLQEELTDEEIGVDRIAELERRSNAGRSVVALSDKAKRLIHETASAVDLRVQVYSYSEDERDKHIHGGRISDEYEHIGA